MEKVRIIIELNKDYIDQRTDLSKILEKKDKEDALVEISNVLCFSVLKRKVNKGGAEYSIRDSSIKNESAHLFNRAVAILVALLSENNSQESDSDPSE
jgi:hypothetical protein